MNGTVAIDCSDRLDDANTHAQLQKRRSDGSYTNYGTGVTSYSTSTRIRVTDGAGGSDGRYRVRGDHFGQHGNIYALDAYFSGSTYLDF